MAETVSSEAAGESPEQEREAIQETEKSAGGLAYWPLCLGLFLFWLAADHATKIWAIQALKPPFDPYQLTALQYYQALEQGLIPRIVIIPGFLQLVYAENTGAAFSFMTGNTFVLGLISLGATIGFSWYWSTLPAKEIWGRMALALLLSGAVGNMIDRFMRGYVVDFIDAYYGQYHWPTFNIADSCICVGAVILAVRFLQKKI